MDLLYDDNLDGTALFFVAVWSSIDFIMSTFINHIFFDEYMDSQTLIFLFAILALQIMKGRN